MKNYLIHANPNAPGYTDWLTTANALMRPIINHPTQPTQLILSTFPNQLKNEEVVTAHRPIEEMPCLTSKDFLTKTPLAISFPLLIGGPCSLESLQQLEQCISTLGAQTNSFIRAGIFKPRTNAHTFQGLGMNGLAITKQLKKKHSFNLVSEITCSTQLPNILEHVSILQVGARNMYNYELLKAIGRHDTPVILKRSPSATYHEWLQAAEYIIREGNPQVILCERGIRTFETATRNTFDINAIPVIQSMTNLPIIADPSHALGMRQFVRSIALAAIQAGADGLLIEAHPSPDESWTDAKQAMPLSECNELFKAARQLYHLLQEQTVTEH